MSTASTAKPDGSMDSIKLPNLAFLRYAVERTLAKFQEANKKDKKMTGASTGTGATSSKAKAKETAMEVDEAAEQEHIKQHYFFPKFLTSRGLLELQVIWNHLFLAELHFANTASRWQIRTSGGKSSSKCWLFSSF